MVPGSSLGGRAARTGLDLGPVAEVAGVALVQAGAEALRAGLGRLPVPDPDLDHDCNKCPLLAQLNRKERQTNAVKRQ
eukprot:SAG22_NODE_188_length_15821_cov_38.313319_2_plen_78_part_00